MGIAGSVGVPTGETTMTTGETKSVAVCECGAEIKGNGGAIAAHLRGKAHAEAMARLLAAKLAEAKPVTVCGEEATITATEGGGAVVEVPSMGLAAGGSTPERAMSAAREAVGLATPIGDDGQPFETAGKIATAFATKFETAGKISTPFVPFYPDAEQSIGRVDRDGAERGEVVWSGPSDGIVVPRHGERRKMDHNAFQYDGDYDRGIFEPPMPPTDDRPIVKGAARKHAHCTNGGYMRKAIDVRKASAFVKRYIQKHASDKDIAASAQ